MTGQLRSHSSQQWETYRGEITRLYASQDLPLKDVVAIMNAQYSFLATERQYKRRIWQWRLDKNVKHSEMRAIARKMQCRTKVGKKTGFRVRKRPVAQKKIERFMKRHPNFNDSNSYYSRTPTIISYSTVGPDEPRSPPITTSVTKTPFELGSNFESLGAISNSSALSEEVRLGTPVSGISPKLDSFMERLSASGKPYVADPNNFESRGFKPSTGRNTTDSKSSIGDSAVMKEFFDFSAAAKTDVRSTSSATHITFRGRRSNGLGAHESPKLEQIAVVADSKTEVLETLDSLIELAGRVEDQGKLEWSRVLLQRVVRLHRQDFGNKHYSPLAALEALSRILRRQGRYLEAERLLSGALKAFRETGDEKDADTLDCMGLLALVLKDQGRLAEAEGLARRALGARLKSLSPSDAGVLRSKEKLGIVLFCQGCQTEAEQLHGMVLAARLKTLGSDHQQTLNSMHNLAMCLGGQGNFQMMESIYRHIITIEKKTMGPCHPHTLNSMVGAATALGGQKRYKEAELIYRDVVAMRKAVSGDEHPHTLIGMHNLAGILMQQGLHEDAKTLYDQTLEMQRKSLGVEHPSTLTTQASLALVLENLGEDEEAEAACRAAWESRKKVLGPEHPSTLISKAHLAKLLEDGGWWSASLRLYHEILEVRQKILGAEHWLTTSTLKRVEFVDQLIRDDAASIESDEDDEE